MLFFELCPSDGWSRDAFNEVSSELSENIVGALKKLTQQQDELKQQQTDLSNGISSLNIQQTPNQNYIRNNQAQYKSSNKFNNSRKNSGDVETSTEDAADSIITEDVTSKTTTGSTSHK